jgi:transcriptional regulator with XRE-family HTH domain
VLICNDFPMGNSNVTNDEKKYLKRVGAKIRTLRVERGWTLEQVEEHGWNNWQHLQKIEAGKNITLVTLRRVAQLFKLDPSELLKGA